MATTIDAAESVPMPTTESPPSPAAAAAAVGGGSGSSTVDDTVIDVATAHVHEAIRSLLADEVPDLAESKGLLVFSDPYLQITMKSFHLYLNFVVTTWWGIGASVKQLAGGQIALLDFVTLLFFSALVSFVLTLGVIMCLVCKLPLVENVFGIYSRLNGGFSFINSLNTHMFSSLTKREVRHSKAALSSCDPVTGKHFNLEVAKMLLLLSSVVYERTSDGTRGALQATHTLPRVPTHKRKGSNISSTPASASPTTAMFSPGITSSSGMGFPMTPTSMSSSTSPTAPALSSSNNSSSQSRRSQGQQQHRSLHASMQGLYMRTRSAGRHLPHLPSITAASPSHLSSHLHALFGRSASQIRSLLHGSEGDNVIQTLVGRLDIEYEPVSELNSASSSYAAVFWDRRSNWVVLAFKGTSPAEFDEWLTDFDITRVHAGHRLPGYKEVHRGFKERLFPEKEGSRRTPYETIMKALRVITRDLMSRTDKDINVWFTGHSLGCAMATLTYTRALLGLDGLDPRVQLCDAYLYGAPVVCDMASAKVFNEYMDHRQSKSGRVRTVWRVTNHCDAVTTLLPMLGDDPLYPHPSSLFAYAHLGSEVKMRPGSGTSIIIDNYCVGGPGAVPARVVSVKDQVDTAAADAFASDAETQVEGDDATVGVAPGSAVDGYPRTRIGDERVGYGMSERERNAMSGAGANTNTNGTKTAGGKKGRGRKQVIGVPWWIEMLEYVPLAGRMVSHFPGLYFRSLQQMEPGDFVWRRR